MTRSDSKITRMTFLHITEVAALERECFSSPWSGEMLKSALERPSARYFVAVCDSGVRGYIGADFVLDEGYITNVAVSVEYRRRGIARELIHALLNTANDEKLAFLTLEVRESNTGAVALYKSLGFEVCGGRPGFYERPVEDAVIMTIQLSGGGGAFI